MRTGWQRIAESKAIYQTKLSRLTFDVKVVLLERMRDRAKKFKESSTFRDRDSGLLSGAVSRSGL